MIGYEIPSTCTSDDILRFVKTLGKHRYVASRLHLVHAFAIDAAAAACASNANENANENASVLAEAATWAKRALGSGVIDLDSKDERLYRRASDAELHVVLFTFWTAATSGNARSTLREHLRAINALPPEPESLLPFDESREDEMFPILIDAGWELLPIAHLDFERHKGAIQSFDDFEVARFEEESAIPPIVTLHELPVMGAVELLAAFDDASQTARAPFVLWQGGNEAYLDYVLRGVLRAAKLPIDDDD